MTNEPDAASADVPAPARGLRIIQRKVTIPRVADSVVRRSRLEVLLGELMENHRIVVVAATAGSGKSTAIVAAVGCVRGRTAWLTLDHTDVAPGRLVTYLEAALTRIQPEINGVATGALAAGIPHAEAAGLLAESLGDAPVVLVIDELERLGEEPDAWRVIAALVRYAPPQLCLVLVSRRGIPVVCQLPPDAVAVLGEGELAFDADEAKEALTRAGKDGVDPVQAVAVTGGWVTGVLFEGWRSAEHVAGMGGEADPLYGYLSSQILRELDPVCHEFLETVSLLDEVTAPRAEALGVREAGRRLLQLRAAHLPVTWSRDGRVMRCHSRFREYLVERLERRGSEACRSLHTAHGRLLAAEGNDEEATAELLRAGALTEALVTAERAIMPVIERLDFAVAERWLDALAGAAPAGASALTIAELMLALGKDDFRHGVQVADQLEALGERDRLAATSELAAWVMAWCYMHVIRGKDVLAVLSAARPGPAVEAVRYAARVMVDPPGEDRPVRPELTGTPADAVIYMADSTMGRLGQLTEASGSRWVEAVKLPYRITALRATGLTQRALELYRSAEATGASLMSRAYVGPEVLIDADEAEEARRTIAEARVIAHRTGSVALEAMNALAEAKLALRVDRDPAAARTALERRACRLGAAGYRVMNEIRDMWHGLALLLASDDEALGYLSRSVDSMVAGDRILELPTAAVYLAEAEWRAGNEDAADQAAELAVEAARRQGSNHLLLQALADFPAVVSRQVDSQRGVDSTWHELGRALIAQHVAVTATVRASVELLEYGRRAIFVDGETVRPRIAKSYEVLAYLASRRPHRARRHELLEDLFGARTDESTRSYLRQAINGLRRILPDGAITVDDGQVSISGSLSVATDSSRFESQLVEAARLRAEERLSATLAALAICDRGEYLPGARSRWADDRGTQLADLATDARYEAAELALGIGRHDKARWLIELVLQADPFREAGWRLAMRIADSLGDERGLVRAYRECERALAQLGAEPSPSTRDLFRRLRR